MSILESLSSQGLKVLCVLWDDDIFISDVDMSWTCYWSL